MAQADDQDRYENLGAVAVLHGPSWDEPAFKQFRAVHPRPQCQATYEVCSFSVDARPAALSAMPVCVHHNSGGCLTSSMVGIMRC